MVAERPLSVKGTIPQRKIEGPSWSLVPKQEVNHHHPYGRTGRKVQPTLIVSRDKWMQNRAGAVVEMNPR